MTFRFAVISLFVVSSAACVPFTAYDLPKVDGVVRDGVTGQPIAGAQILIKSKQNAEVQAKTTSDSSGHFSVPPMTHTVWLPPLPFDPAAPDCAIQVSASGYADREFDLYDTVRAQHGHTGANGWEFDFDLRHN